MEELVALKSPECCMKEMDGRSPEETQWPCDDLRFDGECKGCYFWKVKADLPPEPEEARLARESDLHLYYERDNKGVVAIDLNWKVPESLEKVRLVMSSDDYVFFDEVISRKTLNPRVLGHRPCALGTNVFIFFTPSGARG